MVTEASSVLGVDPSGGSGGLKMSTTEGSDGVESLAACKGFVNRVLANAHAFELALPVRVYASRGAGKYVPLVVLWFVVGPHRRAGGGRPFQSRLCPTTCVVSPGQVEKHKCPGGSCSGTAGGAPPPTARSSALLSCISNETESRCGAFEQGAEQHMACIVLVGLDPLRNQTAPREATCTPRSRVRFMDRSAYATFILWCARTKCSGGRGTLKRTTVHILFDDCPVHGWASAYERARVCVRGGRD